MVVVGGLVIKSCPTLGTPWIVARQAPLSMGFPRQEHWSGLPFPFPGDVPNPGIEHVSPALQVNSLPSELPGKPQINWPLSKLKPLWFMGYCQGSDKITHRMEETSANHI